MTQGQLIRKYTPADYEDCFCRTIPADREMTADKLFERMFCQQPKIVRMLMKLRDAMVKPLGLKTGGTFRDRILERTDEEIIVGADDKHLQFRVSVYCSAAADGQQTAAVSTIVKYNNWLGRLYFAFIWVGHKMIVGSLLNRAIK